MDPKYAESVRRIKNYAENDNNVMGVILLGSQVRKEVPGDQWSDLDVLLITQDTSHHTEKSTPCWRSTKKFMLLAMTCCMTAWAANLIAKWSSRFDPSCGSKNHRQESTTLYRRADCWKIERIEEFSECSHTALRVI